MGSSEITSLRKNGHLDEALELALKEYGEKPHDKYVKNALAWVYRDKIKNLNTDEFQSFFINFSKLLELKLQLDQESFLLSSLLWDINKFGWRIIKHKPFNKQQLSDLLTLAEQIPVIKSESNSVVIKMFYDGFKEDKTAFYRLVKWQGFDNFITQQDSILDQNKKIIDDYKPTKYQGIVQKALVEKYVGTYCKHLIAEIKLVQDTQLTKTIKSFLPLIENLIENHPNYEWLPYYQSSLYAGIGEKEVAKNIILPFVKTHTNDFWVWDKLGDLLTDQEEKLSCYCRGMLCSTPPKKLVNLRKKLILCFLTISDFSSAKHELLQLIECYKKENWSIRGQISYWQNSQWFKNTEANKDNNCIYKEYASLIEPLLYGDIESKTIIITWHDKQKKSAGFEVEGVERTNGKIYGTKVLHIKPFDTYSVKLVCNDSGYLEVISDLIPFSNDQYRREFVREVKGEVVIHKPNSYGFIKDQLGDVYVPPKIVEDYNLKNGDTYSGVAVKSWHREKESWSWSINEEIDS